MISLLNTKLTDRSVVAACQLAVSLRGTGLSTASVPAMPDRGRTERPIQAPAVAAAAMAGTAYGFAAANGAGAGTATIAFPAGGFANGNGQQKTTQHGKWAFRGLEPWSDPA
ncbi:hypothetical protein [Streptomyces sp. HPF1205]|uniref:hypothetical protein n=1 Tax=Streptomyces sp. HPF1205 TaxID=2873262 RepID=UPI001CEC4E41|nr:hypothetical protein [Streptomyces sp. HPF1205]